MPDTILHRAVKGKTDDRHGRLMPALRMDARADRRGRPGSILPDRFRDRRACPKAPRVVSGVATMAGRSGRQPLPS